MYPMVMGSEATILCEGEGRVGLCCRLIHVYSVNVATLSDPFYSVSFIFIVEKVLKAYGELDGDLHLVTFPRDGGRLGVTLAGNRNYCVMSVFVHTIRPNGCVAKDGRIRVGDEILEVCYFSTHTPFFYM